jgi:hypothetical protein
VTEAKSPTVENYYSLYQFLSCIIRKHLPIADLCGLMASCNTKLGFWTHFLNLYFRISQRTMFLPVHTETYPKMYVYVSNLSRSRSGLILISPRYLSMHPENLNCLSHGKCWKKKCMCNDLCTSKLGYSIKVVPYLTIATRVYICFCPMGEKGSVSNQNHVTTYILFQAIAIWSAPPFFPNPS